MYVSQKDAYEKIIVEELEQAMLNYASEIKRVKGIDIDLIPGTGAVSWIGGGLVAFLDTILRPRIDTILDIVNFDSMVKDANLVAIIGEGKIDG